MTGGWAGWIVADVMVILWVREALRTSFYRSYFRTKQELQGKNPDIEVKAAGGVLWWLL